MTTKTVYQKTKDSQDQEVKTELISKKILNNVKEELHKIKPSPQGFVIFPPQDKIKFDTQEIKEKILLLMRAHIITNFKWIIQTILFIIISLLVFTSTEFLNILPSNYAFMTVLIWLLFLFAFIVEKSLSWYFNVYIITDERVIDIDFYSLTAKRISETKIDKIEDVSYSQGGILQSFFNYGTVDIQTSAEKTEFDFADIPYPERIASILNQLILHEEQEKIEGRIS
jgi:uncharacterized membrane protein YdbT with pleckstrin-like domain